MTCSYSLTPPLKILIIGPAWVGDMIMAQSLFKLIKHSRPNATIDVLAPIWTYPLLARMPEVHQAHLSPFKHGQLAIMGRYRLAKRLQKTQYQQAIILPQSSKSAWIPFIAGIKTRTGWLGESRWGLINDIRKRDRNHHKRMVEQFCQLGLAKDTSLPQQLPNPQLTHHHLATQNAIKKFNLHTNKTPILALCPGAEYGPSKRWPPEYFASVASHYYKKGWQIWLFGSPKDQPIGQSIQSACQSMCVNLIGKTDLLEAVDLIGLAHVVLTNDSGLMHVAAAEKRPLVVLYGSSSARFTPPLTERSIQLSLSLPCKPCFKRTCPLHHFRCMRNLLPSQAIQAIDQLASQYGASAKA